MVVGISPAQGALGALWYLALFVVAFICFVIAPMLVLAAAALAYWGVSASSGAKDSRPVAPHGNEPIELEAPRAGFGAGVQ